MKKILVFASLAALLAANAFATYIVVLKNGQTYKAKAKWTMQNGKAIVQLENGQSLAIDPTLIDVAKSEQTTAAGLGGAKILNTVPNTPAPQPQQQEPGLGSEFHLKKTGTAAQQVPAPSAQVAPPPSLSTNGTLSQEVLDKFARAYENVGLFEQKITSPAPGVVRAELTADSEDKVFNAISATSFLIVRNAGVPGADVKMVELFMKTTVGGSAGRFQMTREDAQALDSKQMSQQDYFIRRVIY
ncbi:MAG TPA: hypothetical protein VHU41_07805 [Thermoanaerobaculia bacterium]|jgi:hypothetical protein|nr:hypothetical protein [Thermoanaerobaculia bacterium]